MINMGLIQGSKVQAVPIIVGVDTVYVHTNIKKLDVRSEFDERETEIYEYNEVQYGKDEYIQLLSESTNESEKYILENDFRLSLLEMGVSENDL